VTWRWLWLQVAGAVKAGLLKPADLDTALRRTYLMRFKTGQFDPPGSNPWSKLSRSSVLQQPKHIELARTVAQKGALHARCYAWLAPAQ
jgi:beta-glucosidase